MPRLLNHLTRKRTLAESSKIRGEVFWERRLKVEWVAGNGVIEAKTPGMEELAGGRIGKAPVKGRLAIKCIADDGGAKGGEMNTDLVGAPGLNVAFYTSKSTWERGEHVPMGYGPLAAKSKNRHFLAVGRAMPNVRVKCSGERRDPMDDGNVGLPKIACGEGVGKRLIGPVIFGDDHDA